MISNIINETKLSVSEKFLLILSAAYMLHNSPYIGVRMPAMLFAGIVVLLFIYICLLFSRYRNVFSYLLPVFALFFLDLCFYKSIGVNDSKSLLILISEVFQTLTLPLLAGYAITRQNTKLSMCLLLIFLSVELVTYFSSILAELEFPGIIRLNPGQLKDDDSNLYAMKTSLNVGSFNTVYGAATLIPIAILIMKYRNELFDKYYMRIASILSPFFFLYFIYTSQFTIALAGSILLMCTLFCPKCITPSFFKRSILVGLVTAFFINSMVPLILHTVADSIESPIMADRLDGIALTFEGDEDTGSEGTERRKEVYMKSLSTILDTFFMGTWNENGIGGHSYILDHIARYGLVGVLLLIIFYKGIINQFYQPFREELWSFYYLYGLLGVSIFLLFNPSPLYDQLTFCYPLSAFLIHNKLQKK